MAKQPNFAADVPGWGASKPALPATEYEWFASFPARVTKA